MSLKLKKILLIPFILLSLLFIDYKNVDAASFTVSANTSSVSAKGKFTVTIRVAGAGQFSVSVSNGSGGGSVWVDGSASVSITAGSSGTTKVTVSAVDVTANDESEIKGSKSVSVSIKSSSSGSSNSTSNNSTTTKPNNPTNNNQNSNTNNSTNTNQNANTNNTQEPEVNNLSTDNQLASLSVTPGKIDPTFNANQTTYNIDLAGNVNEVTINAKAKDAKAKVSGTGKKSVKVGDTTYKVICTAENGSQKTYTLIFHVDETPLVYTKYNDTDYGVIRDLENVKVPSGFKATKTKLGEDEIDAFKNDNLQLTLTYLVNEQGDKDFYIVDNGQVVSRFIQLSINNMKMIVMKAPDDLQLDSQWIQQTLSLNDMEIPGWISSNEEMKNYQLFYLMNTKTGESGLYQYEVTEGTLQKYVAPIQEETDNTMTYVFMGTTVLFAVTTVGMYFYLRNFKKKSISAIKAYYDKKNQG